MSRSNTASVGEFSSAGLIILDAFVKPLHLNRAAVDILAYPENPRNIKSLEDFLTHKIRSILQAQSLSSHSGLVSQFVSGRRRYHCRAFSLDSRSNSKPDTQTTFALLIERPVQLSFDTLRIAAKFQLTQRERETLEFVVQGYTSKEIASRMGISPNTVKAFIRIIMMKTGATTRSGIIGRILALKVIATQIAKTA